VKKILPTLTTLWITFTVGFLGVYLYHHLFSDWMIWSLNDAACYELFLCSPSEFFELDYESCGLSETVRNKAYIDDMGDLNIVFSIIDAKAWKASSFLNDFGDNPRISFDPDSGKLTLSAYAETYSADLSESYRILFKEWIKRGLEDIPEDAIRLKLVIQDGGTGEIFYDGIYNGKWIPELRDISASEWNMSSLPKE